jgi:hypothetical protein
VAVVPEYIRRGSLKQILVAVVAGNIRVDLVALAGYLWQPSGSLKRLFIAEPSCRALHPDVGKPWLVAKSVSSILEV